MRLWSDAEIVFYCVVVSVHNFWWYNIDIVRIGPAACDWKMKWLRQDIELDVQVFFSFHFCCCYLLFVRIVTSYSNSVWCACTPIPMQKNIFLAFSSHSPWLNWCCDRGFWFSLLKLTDGERCNKIKIARHNVHIVVRCNRHNEFRLNYILPFFEYLI